MYAATRTGTNNIPLGTRRKRGSGGESEDQHRDDSYSQSDSNRYISYDQGSSSASASSYSHGQSASYPADPVVKQEVKQEGIFPFQGAYFDPFTLWLGFGGAVAEFRCCGSCDCRGDDVEELVVGNDVLRSCHADF